MFGRLDLTWDLWNATTVFWSLILNPVLRQEQPTLSGEKRRKAQAVMTFFCMPSFSMRVRKVLEFKPRT
jgi:hypothetical protein